ncbi:hypothetical protein THASP1DRAFT_33873 [Thamnocephalis sphaerospora]|uniref:Armadillo-type protein n=1 Tax=Thamnocephalis sphaerospora TaxID=78915 RepID=A0A4P9XFM0_9FUNG|nr:hypothetical protein THASP1DRAFT_33873 [Thamnocephalis sphaerospora]|eukprot:RKP04372.1 hypothetical protein THASP1DRAFT_33873 [Thamnocephalis sphaerospora]
MATRPRDRAAKLAAVVHQAIYATAGIMAKIHTEPMLLSPNGVHDSEMQRAAVQIDESLKKLAATLITPSIRWAAVQAAATVCEKLAEKYPLANTQLLESAEVFSSAMSAAVNAQQYLAAQLSARSVAHHNAACLLELANKPPQMVSVSLVCAQHFLCIPPFLEMAISSSYLCGICHQAGHKDESVREAAVRFLAALVVHPMVRAAATKDDKNVWSQVQSVLERAVSDETPDVVTAGLELVKNLASTVDLLSRTALEAITADMLVRLLAHHEPGHESAKSS